MQTVAESKNGFRETEIGLLPDDWELVKLGEVFDIKQGKAMSPKRRKGISPHPFLRTLNVLWGQLDLTTIDQMDFTEKEISKLRLKSGDLLVCEGGEIGRTAMWRGEIEKCLYQNHIHRLRKLAEDVWPEFYMYWMQAAEQRLTGMYPRQTVNMWRFLCLPVVLRLVIFIYMRLRAVRKLKKISGVLMEEQREGILPGWLMSGSK